MAAALHPAHRGSAPVRRAVAAVAARKTASTAHVATNEMSLAWIRVAASCGSRPPPLHLVERDGPERERGELDGDGHQPGAEGGHGQPAGAAFGRAQDAPQPGEEEDEHEQPEAFEEDAGPEAGVRGMGGDVACDLLPRREDSRVALREGVHADQDETA